MAEYTLTASKDNHLDPIQKGNVFDTQYALCGSWSGVADPYISIIGFPNTYPAGATVVSAILTLTFDAGVGTPSAFKLFRLTQDWVEASTTFLNNGPLAWTTPGGTIDTGVSTAHAGISVAGTYTFDVTALAQAAITAGQPTIGFSMRPDVVSGSNYMTVHHRTHTTPGTQPSLFLNITTSTPPTITTAAATDITHTSATLGGNVTADGGATITERGVCIGASANPTTSDTKLTAAGTVGAFTVTATGTEGGTYHARAYATNSAGTAYGEDVTFTLLPGIHAYLEFTEGGTDGTIVSEDESYSAPIQLATLGAVVEQVVRCSPDMRYPGGMRVVSPHSCIGVSADGVTFGSEATIPLVADTNTGIAYWKLLNRIPLGDAVIVDGRARFTAGFGEAGVALVEAVEPVQGGVLTLTPATGSLLADWTDATDASGIDHYRIEVADNADFTDAESSTSTESAAVIATYGGDPLAEETDWYVRVIAVDVNANESAEITAHSKPLDTTAPTLSGSLTAVAGDGKVTLSGGTASDARGIAGYIIEHGTDTTYGTEVTVTTTATSLPATDIASANGALHYYRVSPFDAAGNRTAVGGRLTASATPVSAATKTLVDSYSETTAGSYIDLGNFYGIKGLGQSFTAQGGTLDSIKFFLGVSKVGTLGTVTANIYAHSGTFGASSVPNGTALATVTANVADLGLSTTHKLVTFQFNNTLALTAGAKYVVTYEYTGGTSSYYLWGKRTATGTHAGNCCYGGPAWTADPGYDLPFYVYEMV